MSQTQDPFVKVHSLVKQGKLRMALKLLLNPESERINDLFRFDLNHAWYCVGDIQYKLSDFENAKKAFKKALRSRPDDVQGLMAVGSCYDELRKPRFAERYFIRALICSKRNNEGDRVAIMFNLANALFDQDRMEEAITLYKKLDRSPMLIRRMAKKNLDLAKKKIA